MLWWSAIEKIPYLPRVLKEGLHEAWKHGEGMGVSLSPSLWRQYPCSCFLDECTLWPSICTHLEIWFATLCKQESKEIYRGRCSLWHH